MKDKDYDLSDFDQTVTLNGSNQSVVSVKGTNIQIWTHQRDSNRTLEISITGNPFDTITLIDVTKKKKGS